MEGVGGDGGGERREEGVPQGSCGWKPLVEPEGGLYPALTKGGGGQASGQGGLLRGP